MKEEFKAHLTEVSPGQIVEAEVIRADETSVIVNLNYKFEGYIDRNEFENPPVEGSKIPVIIKRIDDRRGAVFVSHREARLRSDIRQIRSKIRGKQPVACEVIKLTERGIAVSIKGTVLKGYIPKSSSGIRLQPVKPGDEVEAYAEKINRKTGTVVLNRIKRLMDIREREIDEFLSQLNPGDRLSGRVKNVTDFGAFITIGPVDALVPRAELSWRRLNDPAEVVKVGDIIDVEIINVNREDKKVLASHRATIKTRWHMQAEKVKPGDVYRGRVKKKTDSGYLVWLDDSLDGFLPEEEFGKYISPVRSLDEGDEISVRVDRVIMNKRIILLKHPTR